MNSEKADMVFTDPPYGVSYADVFALVQLLTNLKKLEEEKKD